MMSIPEGVTCVEDIKYMKYMRMLMRQISAWPSHDLIVAKGRWRIYKIFLNFNGAICLLGGALFIKFNYGRISIFDMAIVYITVFMNIICSVRALTTWKEKYNKVIRDFIKKIHLFNIKDLTPYSNEIHLYVHKLSHRFTVYMMTCTAFAYTCFNLVPLINTINNGGFKFPISENVTYVVSVYYAFPFDYLHNFNGYVVVSIINVYETALATGFFVTIDVYLGLLMLHLWGHLKILIYNLEHFPSPKGSNEFADRYNYQELVDVRKRIKSIVEHHNMILQFINDVSEAFGPSIALSYAFYQVCGCVLLFVCSQETEYIVRFGPLTGVLLLLLVQMSLIFELVSSMKDSLINAVYEMPWECMDTANRKSVIIILQQVQRPLGLKALGMVEVGVNTMVAVIKTSISYFAMMRTMATD